MRRALGMIVAVAVAVLGTMLLVGYVRGAEDRALAGEEVVDVLVADTPIERGTPASSLSSLVRTERVPVKVRAEGAVADLTGLGDLVASTDLLPGEQLVAARFVASDQLDDSARIEAPPDALETTVSVSPERALGGQLLPGDVVAVVASFDPFDLNTLEPSELNDGQPIDPGEIFLGSSGVEETNLPRSPASTGIVLYDVLVTAVQVEQLPRTDAADLPEDGPDLAPTGNLLITLAGHADDIERIVFTAEHGFIWLAHQGEDVDPATPSIQTRRTVYR